MAVSATKTLKNHASDWKVLADEEFQKIARMRDEIRASHERTQQAALETRALMATVDAALNSLRNA